MYSFEFITTEHGNYAFTDEIYFFDIPEFQGWFFTYYKFWFERYPFHVFDNTRSINIILTSKDINNNLAKFVVNALLVKKKLN